jgi:nanoRNase/pAp phosphatase (c-di-AMP/oligoRNAs hydrolase)
MDSRTGLGRFRDFTISNYNLMMNLIDACKDHTIEEIMQLPDVVERVELYNKYQDEFIDQLKRCSTIHENVVVLDLREEEIIYPGNRFMIYALYPETNVSIHVIWGFQKQNTVLAVGKSIINRSSSANIGDLMLNYEGGGHLAAGTCQVSHEVAESVLEDVVESLTEKELCEA